MDTMTAPQPTANPPAYRDLYQQVTDTIIDELEKGTVPWHQPWNGTQKVIMGLPKNAKTSNYYRGVNILLLWSQARQKQYDSSEWASFKQWNENKEFIRRGEKSTMILYADVMDKEQPDGEMKKVSFLKCSYVFNRCQLASYKPQEKPVEEQEPENKIIPVEAIDAFINNTNAKVTYKKGDACYNRVKDVITMPSMKYFVDTPYCSAKEGFYATSFHELSHWTGHETRLNRDLGKKFGDQAYAAEELVAEFSAAFLCAEFGIADSSHKSNAAYIENWLQLLKENKYALTTAATSAIRAIDYLKTLQPK